MTEKDKKEVVVLNERKYLTDPTPMMQQYLDIKNEYDDFILLYRLGDFYEMFFEDAILASRPLELTLTGRDCGQGRRAAMCGVPFHKLDQYIAKLLEAGFKAAVCEQTEDPASATGLVRREVVRIVTPGTVTDGSMLNDLQNNYLASVFYTKDTVSVGFADISTGLMTVTHFDTGDRMTRLRNECTIYQPREVILNIPRSGCKELGTYLEANFGTVLTDCREELFSSDTASHFLPIVFNESDKSKMKEEGERRAVAALLAYIEETQKCGTSFIRELKVYKNGQYMELDANTRRNLELTETMRAKERRGSLLWVLDKTETAMGARTLRNWLQQPLLNPIQIQKRQEAVAELYQDYMLREELRVQLNRVYDIERLTAKAVYGTANAKDLSSILESIRVLPSINALLLPSTSQTLSKMRAAMDTMEDVEALLSSALVDDPPFSLREGGIIRDGYNEEVDYLRSVAKDGRSWIDRIEEEEREATGIKTLKIGFNKVFGYYIEVTKSLVPQVPDRYIRKQTLTGCERYITQELKDMEATVLGATDKLCALEFALFQDLRERVAEAAARLQETAGLLASLDVYMSLADVATKYRYVCPEVDAEDVIEIKEGRHPVVERFSDNSYFVPNDTALLKDGDRVMLITGPNMAGKSTYMRQVALITLMAQIGSFVPAAYAHIGIVDKIFTRVGASDDLASGQSTFMLEMNEVAHILKNATEKSLIIYDEVGRGTSTYDGMSIARAVLEYTAGKKLHAKTLFATHYHELTVMEGELPGITNFNIAAKKNGDNLTFLRKIVRGATDDSYGIEVAKLAGLPNEVIRRAREILADIEAGEEKPVVHRSEKEVRQEENDLFSMLVENNEHEVAERLRRADINTLTPIEAMNLIYELKKSLS